MRSIAVVLGMILFLSSTSALAAKVTGKVIVTQEFRDALDEQDENNGKKAHNYYWNQPNGVIPVLPPPVSPTRDLAVVVQKDGAPAESPDDIKSVDVRTGSLEKNVVVTRPGSTIRFLNVSPFNHELYSPQLGSFKPELQSTKAFRAIEFKKEGVYEVRCKLMPHLLAYVVVTEGSTLELKGDGSFNEELEPGKYTLKVFHGGKWVQQEKIDTEGTRSMTVQLKLEPGQAVSATPGAANGDSAGKSNDKAAEEEK